MMGQLSVQQLVVCVCKSGNYSKKCNQIQLIGIKQTAETHPHTPPNPRIYLKLLMWKKKKKKNQKSPQLPVAAYSPTSIIFSFSSHIKAIQVIENNIS